MSWSLKKSALNLNTNDAKTFDIYWNEKFMGAVLGVEFHNKWKWIVNDVKTLILVYDFTTSKSVLTIEEKRRCVLAVKDIYDKDSDFVFNDLSEEYLFKYFEINYLVIEIYRGSIELQ